MASSLRNQLDGTMEAAVKLLQVIAVSNQQQLKSVLDIN